MDSLNMFKKIKIVNMENYLGNYYIKDFQYLRRCHVEKFGERENNEERKDYSSINLKLIVRMWLKEIVNGFKQFLYQGSLHGVKYMFEPSFSRLERASWIAIMIISIGVCGSSIIHLFNRWSSSPFVNVIDSLPTPVWAIPFPTVVLCPDLHVPLSRANITELNELDRFFASLICPKMRVMRRALNQTLEPGQNGLLQEFVTKNSLQCSDILKWYHWGGLRDTQLSIKDCCEKYFRPIYTNYGLCIAFNTLPMNGMKNITLEWQKTFDPIRCSKHLQWGLDTGYPPVLPPDLNMLPMRVMGSGEINGLELELFLNISEHQPICDGHNRGFNLLISSPADHAYTNPALRIPMNRITTIEVYPLTYKTDPALQRLLADQRQCFFQGERQLEYFEYYTDTNCKHDLLIVEAQKKCNCVLFNWPRKNILQRICSTKIDYQCITNVQRRIEEHLIHDYYADNNEGQQERGNKPLSCYPPCNDIIYTTQVFYSDLNNEFDEDIFERKEQSKRGEITKVNIFFHQSTFLGQHRHAQYDDYYFVGAIGGLLSLFLGFSIISIAELIYFVLLRPVALVFGQIYHRNN